MMHLPRLVAITLVVALLPLAGCVQSGPDSPSPTTTTGSPPAKDPSAFLATLAFPAKPDAKRLLTDLEAFTTVAPRRYDNQFQHAAARDWLEARFKEAGLNVTRQTFTGPGQAPGSANVQGVNIVATIAGTHADGLILFGGHYDGAATGAGAAYDDGSGTLITLELARALAKYHWNHTLVFGEWDQEEAGLVGSAAYVKELRKTDADVVQYMNFDMTGINWPAKFGGTADVPLKADFGGTNAANMTAAWNAVVKFLNYPAMATAVATTTSKSGPSDHGSFLAGDYPASWVRGAVIGNYPMYHNADTVQSMIADVGGNRADLEAGFNTVLQVAFLFAFLADHEA